MDDCWKSSARGSMSREIERRLFEAWYFFDDQVLARFGFEAEIAPRSGVIMSVLLCLPVSLVLGRIWPLWDDFNHS